MRWGKMIRDTIQKGEDHCGVGWVGVGWVEVRGE